MLRAHSYPKTVTIYNTWHNNG